jgi:hypothetical protein
MAGVTIALRTEITITDTDADSEAVAQRVVIDKTLTGITDYRLLRFQVQNTSKIIWDAAGSGEQIGSFQLMAVWSDVATELEMTIGEGEGTEELNSVRLGAGAPPLILTADDAYRNHSASDAFAGTLDVIDKLRAKEANNVAATVYLLLAE